jgi:hypothetical protein
MVKRSTLKATGTFLRTGELPPLKDWDEHADKPVNRGRLLAGKIGRAIAYSGVSLLVTPTARTAHSQLGQEIKQVMGPSSTSPAAIEVTKLTVTLAESEPPIPPENMWEYGPDRMIGKPNTIETTEGVE